MAGIESEEKAFREGSTFIHSGNGLDSHSGKLQGS